MKIIDVVFRLIANNINNILQNYTKLFAFFMQEIFLKELPLIFPNSNHIISRKHFKTKEVFYIIDSKRDFSFPHSIESLQYTHLLKIPANFYIKSVLEYIFTSLEPVYSLEQGKQFNYTAEKILEILLNHSKLEFNLEKLENIDFNYAIDRTPGLVGVVINISRRETSIEYKTQLSNHIKKFLGYCRIKDVSDRLRTPRSFILHAYLLRLQQSSTL